MKETCPTIHIVYASTSGNVEAVVDKVAEILRRHKFDVTLTRSEQTPIEKVKKNELFLFASSTWNTGQLNPFFIPLFNKMREVKFKGKKAMFIGLGDTRYHSYYFCRAINLIHELWTDNGGEAVYAPLRINGEPYDLLDTNVTIWTKKVISELRKVYA